MPEYTYVAQDADGKEKKGNVVADTPQNAVELVSAEGLIVLSVKEANILNKELSITFGRLVKPRDLSVFCRQFVSMLSSGVTVIAALDMLSNQTENKHMAKALREVQTDIMKGETLADAMSRHKKIFPEIMVSMVRAGEASGKMEIAFERMSEHFEKAAATEGMVRKAAMYPIIVAIVAVITELPDDASAFNLLALFIDIIVGVSLEYVISPSIPPLPVTCTDKVSVALYFSGVPALNRNVLLNFLTVIVISLLTLL